MARTKKKKPSGNKSSAKNRPGSSSARGPSEKNQPHNTEPQDAPDDNLDVNFQHYSSGSEDGDRQTDVATAENAEQNSRKRQRGSKSKPTSNSNDMNSDSDSGSDDDDDDIDDDEEERAEIQLNQGANEESDVEVTLDFYDPREADAPALSTFLERWTHRAGGGEACVISEVVTAQNRVGTTVRVDEEDAPVAFITALNVRRHKATLKKVLKRIAKRSSSEDDDGEHANDDASAAASSGAAGGDIAGQGSKKKKAGLLGRTVRKCLDGDGRFESEKMGLVLWERVVNLPPLVLPKMLEALFCEVEWAVEDEPTEEGREDFRMGWFLYVTEVLVGTMPDGAEAEVGQQRQQQQTDNRKKKKARTKENETKEEINFTRAEDEAWYEFAADTIDWPISDAEKSKGGVTRRGMAMLLAAAKVPAMRKRVEEMVGAVEGIEDDDAAGETTVADS